jgi:hypothetical protein
VERGRGKERGRREEGERERQGGESESVSFVGARAIGALLLLSD